MSWSAKISKESMACALCDDLLKKFRQLHNLPDARAKQIGEGLIDGLKGVTFAYPNNDLIPDYRKSMDPDYCAGHEVGTTWAKVAREWDQSVSPWCVHDWPDKEGKNKWKGQCRSCGRAFSGPSSAVICYTCEQQSNCFNRETNDTQQ